MTATHCDHVDLTGAVVSRARLRFSNVDLSGVHFENAALAGATIRDANLSGMAISGCDTPNMRIDGYLVSDLIAAYRKSV